MSREEALRLYTQGSSWFSNEDDAKGGLYEGQLADFAVLTGDYFSIPESEIKQLQSALTVVGGEVVYANKDFANLAPPPLPPALDWAPPAHYGGYHDPSRNVIAGQSLAHAYCGSDFRSHARGNSQGEAIRGLGCDCFAF